MTLLELCHELGLDPKRTAATKGGEYHSSCPECGGCDRFAIWPNEGRTGHYWCRQCKRHGDGIQFYRDFLGMSFKEAQIHAGASRCEFSEYREQRDWAQSRKPTGVWIEKAEEFVESCHQRLLIDQEAMATVAARGLTLETTKMHRLGWNPMTRFCFHSEWGLEGDVERPRFCLPIGMVIPAYNRFEGDCSISKIKIRRADWKESDKWPKYYEVPGSSKAPALYGFRVSQIAMLVEAELDALLVLQETEGICTCVALGGATKRPDAATAEWLKGRRLILFSLDFDDAGDNEYHYWASSFPQLGKWRSDSHKSPADSFLLGNVNLREWFLAGVEFWEAAKND